MVRIIALASCLALITVATARADSVIPPIVLQGCSPKGKPAIARLVDGSLFARGAVGVGYDVSFVNTTNKVATIVMIQIGADEFTKIGTFSPNAVVAWRLDAPPGPCSIRAIRFKDGSEWAAPTPHPEATLSSPPAAISPTTAPVPQS